MERKNPYQTPQSELAGAAEEFQPVRIFSTSGRIGRVRYIAYSIGLGLLFTFLAGLLSALLVPIIGEAATLLALGAWVAIIVISIMLTIQRCHDFDTSGWLSILGLIPLVNLIFWFIPGSDGPNRFGARTPPNSVLAIVIACILPVVFILGIVAAVAIPAYQDYVKRAATHGSR